MGDYEATLFSEHSNNCKYGESVVQGKETDNLAEGYYTLQAVMKIKEKLGVEMPICEAVYQVLFNKEDPLDA